MKNDMKLLNGADQAFDRQMFKLTVDVNSGKRTLFYDISVAKAVRFLGPRGFVMSLKVSFRN